MLRAMKNAPSVNAGSHRISPAPTRTPGMLTVARTATAPTARAFCPTAGSGTTYPT